MSLPLKPDIRETNASEDTCCFGMIIGLGFKQSEWYKVNRVPNSLSIESDSNILVETDTKKTFGEIDPNGGKVLEILRKELIVQLLADYTISRSKEARNSVRNLADRSKRTTSQPDLELFAILYGPSTLFEAVGTFAAKCHLYLQHPRHCNRNVPYRNPHCLSPEDGRTIFTFDLHATLDSSHSELEILANPIDLFADASEQDTLNDTNTPHNLSTELYKHQKQALTFMLRRERGWVMNGQHKDIWREEHDSYGRPVYQNLISGMKQMKRPDEFRGGLLIDAPGLGKSLSIIALISSDVENEGQDLQAQQSLSTTLLIVPKTLIQMWKDELQKHLRSADSLRTCVYYGKDRKKYLEELAEYRLVITTYSVVRLDWKIWLVEPDNLLTLHAIRWRRIVLDEAHIIREPSKSFAKSTCALQAERRLVSTATPIQNRLSDLFSLFKFLRCYPFDEQKVFNDQVVQKWRTRADPESVAKLKTLITCLALRRPKTTIELLPRKDEVIHLRFNREECEDYQKVKSQTIYKIGNVNGEGGGTSFLNALKWVNELRLMCIHGTRNAKEMQQIEGSQPAWSMQQAQTGFDELEKAGLAKCLNTLCSQDLSSTLSSETGAEHEDEPWISESLELWCSSCFNSRNTISPKAFKVCNHLPRRLQKKNIMDEKGINVFGDDSSIRSSLDTADKNGRLPTKVKALLQHLLEAPEDTKSVIFSSWTKTFDIIQPQLWKHSIRCVRLDGTLSANGRSNVLRVFRTNPGIRVLLATISCGGIGLDLTAASHAYIMEPQWNPMSESQALDRIYRLGQRKEVTTTRFIMRDSFEEQVLTLQRRKQELADLTLSGGGINKAELTYGRLRYLRELVG